MSKRVLIALATLLALLGCDPRNREVDAGMVVDAAMDGMVPEGDGGPDDGPADMDVDAAPLQLAAPGDVQPQPSLEPRAQCSPADANHIVAVTVQDDALNQACPVIEGFDGQRTLVGRDGAARVPFLTDYCTYTLNDAGRAAIAQGAADQPIDLLTNQADGTLIDPGVDCSAVATVGTPLDDAVNPLLYDDFRAQLDIANVGLSPDDIGNAGQVRIEVLDTWPETRPDAATRRAQHGPAVAGIAALAGCGPWPERCPVQINPRLALGRYEDDQPPDLVAGGHYGTLTDVAQAIVAAVDADGQRPRVVINLSLGWEPRGQLETRLSPRLLDGDAHQALLTRLDRREATGVPGPTRAVHAALVYASCRGAIVIGAAGNRADDDADANGPLLPGGWEALPAPDAETCRALGVSADPLPQPGDERPLIWAAGGIDEADEPIANARPDGEPKLVIAGPNALGVDPAVDDSIPPLTGSSAAAAAVSGTAALVWSLAPDMPTDEVMARVYNSGRDLGRPAAFCLNRASGCGEAVHRVSPCLAVGGACVAPLPTAGLLAAIEMALDALGLPAGNAQPAQPVPVPACGGDTFAVPGLADGYKPCPSVTELDVKTAPWVSPQPSEPMCPTCAFYGGSGKLFVNLAPHDAANSPYTNLTLVVTTASGDKWYSISSSITPGTSLVFTGLSTAGALKSRVEAVAEKMVMGAPLDVAVTDTVITSP